MPRKRNKKKFPRLAIPEVLQIDIPRDRLATFGLDRHEERLHAAYIAQNGTAVLYDGRSYRTVPVEDALDLSVWVADHGVSLIDSGEWIVIDATSGVGCVLPAKTARRAVELQWDMEGRDK